MIIRKKISIEHNFNSGYWYLIHPNFVFKTKDDKKFKEKVMKQLDEMSMLSKDLYIQAHSNSIDSKKVVGRETKWKQKNQ